MKELEKRINAIDIANGGNGNISIEIEKEVSLKGAYNVCCKLGINQHFRYICIHCLRRRNIVPSRRLAGRTSRNGRRNCRFRLADGGFQIGCNIRLTPKDIWVIDSCAIGLTGV